MRDHCLKHCTTIGQQLLLCEMVLTKAPVNWLNGQMNVDVQAVNTYLSAFPHTIVSWYPILRFSSIYGRLAALKSSLLFFHSTATSNCLWAFILFPNWNTANLSTHQSQFTLWLHQNKSPAQKTMNLSHHWFCQRTCWTEFWRIRLFGPVAS